MNELFRSISENDRIRCEALSIKTNAQQIRSMSDYELAQWLTNLVISPRYIFLRLLLAINYHGPENIYNWLISTDPFGSIKG